jgi:hypothetical protein
LKRTHSLLVFIYPKVTTYGVSQGVPRFVSGGPRTTLDHHPTRVRAAVRPGWAVLDMPQIVIELTLHTLWDYYAGLLVGLVMSIDMQLRESGDTLKRP